MRLFSDVWSENAALFERLMEIHSNPPILYYGFNPLTMMPEKSQAGVYGDCVLYQNAKGIQRVNSLLINGNHVSTNHIFRTEMFVQWNSPDQSE